MTSSNKDQIQWLLNAATDVLKASSDGARLDAELLLCHVLDCDRTYLFTWADKVVEPKQQDEFKNLIALRSEGRPVAHLVGHREFWDLTLKTTPDTLIPRPDTEILVEQALDVVNQLQLNKVKGLDLGTGTGAIALSLASELPDSSWIGVDAIPDAVKLAQHNAGLNKIDNCVFKQSDWFSALDEEKFDLIVSNPPYIDEHDPHLSEGDVRFEPLSALVAKDRGFSDIKHIIDNARCFLADKGCVLLEHGYQQAEEVRAIFSLYGYQNIATFVDISGNDRVTVGYFK